MGAKVNIEAISYIWQSFLLPIPIVNRAWLRSEIFPKYGNAVEWEKTIANRLQRATSAVNSRVLNGDLILC